MCLGPINKRHSGWRTLTASSEEVLTSFARPVIPFALRKDQTTTLLKWIYRLYYNTDCKSKRSSFKMSHPCCPIEDSGMPLGSLELLSWDKVSTLKPLYVTFCPGRGWTKDTRWEDPACKGPGDLVVDLRNTGGLDEQCQCVHRCRLNTGRNFVESTAVLNLRELFSCLSLMGKRFCLLDKDFFLPWDARDLFCHRTLGNFSNPFSIDHHSTSFVDPSDAPWWLVDCRWIVRVLH